MTDGQKSPPRVSVIMPAYNGERFIGEAVKSILAQSLTDLELIVVDDGSTDRTREIVRAFNDPRIRVVSLPENCGSDFAANRAIAESRGEYVARMDQDDLSHPARLQRQVDFMDRNPKVVLVGASAEYIDDFGGVLGVQRVRTDPDEVGNRLLFGTQFIHSSILARRGALVEVKGYTADERVKGARDYDLFLRLSEVGKVANLPDVLVSYRLHSQQMSSRILHNRKSAENCRILAHYRRSLAGAGGFARLRFRAARWWASSRGVSGTLGRDLQESAAWYRRLGQLAMARRCAVLAMLYAPLSPATWTGGGRIIAESFLPGRGKRD